MRSSNSDNTGPTPKGYVAGTHRAVPPEETLARIRPLARAMGITRVATITGLDVIGIPVVAVVRPNSRSIAVAQGKGLDLPSAKVSGLMEAMENFHGELGGDLRARRGDRSVEVAALGGRLLRPQGADPLGRGA